MKFNGLLFLMLTLHLTAQCQRKKMISKPEKDFENFWVTFKNNYAFFQLKGVNWDSSYLKFRPLVTKKTKQQELVSILGQMVEPLKDGHITISKGEEILFKSKKPSYFKQEFKGIEKEFWETVCKTLEDNNFSAVKGIGPSFKDEHLYYVSKSSNVGYIRITRCFANPESIFDDRKENEDTQLMLSLFDHILDSLSSTKSIIIDIRANGGGHGGIELASRFTKEKVLTHYKAIKVTGNYESFTTPAPNYLTPNSGTKYLNPIIILTNDKTASSAEDFAISLYQLPGVTTIGTNTSGMLSDMFSAELSKKISFTLSNQVYYSTSNEILEDKGVPVNFQLINKKQDIENKQDPLIIKAMEIIYNIKSS